MATKDTELLETVNDELKVIQGALVQVRAVQKALEGSRDTLNFVKNVLTQRKDEIPADARKDATRDSWKEARS